MKNDGKFNSFTQIVSVLKTRPKNNAFYNGKV